MSYKLPEKESKNDIDKTPVGGHYYGLTTSGEAIPCYSIKTADGKKLRGVTARDIKSCRKGPKKIRTADGEYEVKSIYPSVTTISSIIHKPALENWKFGKIILAAKDLKRPKNMPDQTYFAKVTSKAFVETEKAATFGSEIHHHLELVLDDPEHIIPKHLLPYLEPVQELISTLDLSNCVQESCLINEEDFYAGKADVLYTKKDGTPGILDWKTKKTKPGVKIVSPNAYPMQLSAYAVAAYGEECLEEVEASNVFISSTEPGRVEHHYYKDLRKHFNAFRNLVQYWKYEKGL